MRKKSKAVQEVSYSCQSSSSEVRRYPARSNASQSYFDKLNDPRWQRKRLKIMERDDFKCTQCGDATTKLNVHHEYYISLRDPWSYPDAALVTLCEPCHKLERSFDAAFTPNDYREWELILTALRRCKNHFDFSVEFLEFQRVSGKEGHEVADMVIRFLKEKRDNL